MKLLFTATKNSISIFIDGKMEAIQNTHPRFEEIKEALRKEDHDKDEIAKLLIENSLKHLNNEFAGIKSNSVSVDVNGNVYIDGELLNNYFSERVKFMFEEGFPVKPFVEFMKKLLMNPSEEARGRLFAFLDKNKSPITEDGDFITFKNVSANFKDLYTGKFDNSPGKIVEVDRNEVDPNSNVTCSYGLHVAASSYLHNYYAYGATTVVCKVNPRDVVAVPPDYNETKMRVCRYEVVSEVQNSSNINQIETSKVVDASLNEVKDAPKTETSIVKEKTKGTSFDFKTSDGRIISSKVLVSLSNSGNSASKISKQLSVPESTVRGWLKKVAGIEKEKVTLTFNRNGISYSEDEILAGIRDCGSQTQYAKTVGIPSGTLSGWVKKIRQNAE